jgi:hypothetical protein
VIPPVRVFAEEVLNLPDSQVLGRWLRDFDDLPLSWAGWRVVLLIQDRPGLPMCVGSA